MEDLQNIFYNMENHFYGAISQSQQIIDNSAIAYYPTKALSVLLQRKAVEEPEKIIMDAAKFFAKNKVPNWSYLLPHDLDTPLLNQALKKHNFLFANKSTAMYCNKFAIENYVSPQKQTLIIKQVDPDNCDFLQILHSAFDGEGESTNQFSQALLLAQSKGIYMQHFIGLLDSLPVSSITLTFLNNCVRIDNVATHPKYQGLGYASQIVKLGLEYALVKNTMHYFLDASSSGLTMYKRLGFYELFTYRIFALGI